MKKEEFMVEKGPTPFKQMCDEHEVSYKEIALSSGVPYQTLAKAACRAQKSSEEALSKLNEVCEPIFGKTLTLEDFGFHTEPAELVTMDGLKCIESPLQREDDPETESVPVKKTTRKQTRKKGGRTKAKAVAKPKPEEPETETKAVTIRVAIEQLSRGYVLRDGDGWSECHERRDNVSYAVMERIYDALDESCKGYVLEIKVRPVTDLADFYNLKRV